MIFDPTHTQKARWVDRGWYVVTEFERTPSINFQRTVELAKTHPEFTALIDERNVMIYRNIYRESDLLHFQQMYKLIKNWKGAKLYVKGDRIDFDMIGSGIQCYLRTILQGEASRHDPDGCKMFEPAASHFLGCLGCHRSHVSMEWHRSCPSSIPVWFAFGGLNHNQVYIIHKQDLESEAIGELIDYRFCPLLNLAAIRECIGRLPDRIDPRKDREWKYQRRRKNRTTTTAHQSQHNGFIAKEPEILPASEEAYYAYLKRKMALPSSGRVHLTL
jgi:hypothetical protein